MRNIIKIQTVSIPEEFIEIVIIFSKGVIISTAAGEVTATPLESTPVDICLITHETKELGFSLRFQMSEFRERMLGGDPQYRMPTLVSTPTVMR